MKILWLCNLEIPIISKHLNKKNNVFGGWLEQISNRLCEENDMIFLYPCEDLLNGKINNLSFSQFSLDNCENLFNKILKDNEIDLIHIWGTEFHHTSVMVKTLEKMNLIDKLVINIQGLVSIYALHYFVGLPLNLIKHKTIHEFFRGGNIYQGMEKYQERGIEEEYSIRHCINVIGRTDFDYSSVKMINNAVNYHFCNEVLRPQFYTDKWDINKINRHTIFISQANYPIKGFHFMLMALPIIKKIYPDVLVITTGANPLDKSKDKLRRLSYEKYLSELIIKNDLEHNLKFVGFLNAEEMKAQYLSCNVFVSTSTIENSPNSIGEAMLLGCPVVASNVGGIKNMLVDEKEGLLYPVDEFYMLASYIKRIFSDDSLAIKLGNNAKDHAIVTHDFEKNYNNMLDIYKQIIKKKN